jgi:hypothetical protein
LIRLHLVVEGQTEESFVRDILAPELWPRGVTADVHRVTTGRKRSRVFRGGITTYQQLRNDLLRWMTQDPNLDAWFSTMVDLYRLPRDFPQYADSRKEADPVKRVRLLEESLQGDIQHARFIPYIQLHEFEALLFADPEKFEHAFPGRLRAIAELQRIRSQFRSPEQIDDGEDTAPSKRIAAVVPGYAKAVAGPLIVRQIGMATLRRECEHFHDWMTRLEHCLVQSGGA